MANGKNGGGHGFSRRRFLKGAAGAGAVASGLVALPEIAAGAPNAISTENAKPGTPSEEWSANGATDIAGFTTDFSAVVGGTVTFKIATPATNYRIRIFRLGWYGGDGARLIATVTPSVPLPQVQPDPVVDSASGLIDCGNWAPSATWTVPASAVPGIYYALLERLDGPTSSNHILFVVRRQTASDILVQTSDATWQAYNVWGGKSLYGDEAFNIGVRAYKVSYNRPLRAGEPENDFFANEWPLVRWLERNGYDVSYCGNVDTHRYPSELLNRKVFVSSGHDEYWSGAIRTNVEAARAAGVHVIFMTGNEVFWRTRMEPAIAGPATNDRTLVCYKETLANAKIDPSPEWTGTWRDPRFTPPAQGGGNPENALTGQLFRCILPVRNPDNAIQVPSDLGKLRFWRNTTLAQLLNGQVATLVDNSLGYEYDVDADNGFRPNASIRLSATTLLCDQVLQDYGSTYTPEVVTHNMTVYRASSGALVWGTGTVQWAYGLDGDHSSDPGTPVSRDMQQATLNMLADMGVQPATRQSDLVAASASTDTLAPVATITSPAAGATVTVGTPFTVSGTATDAGGGLVAVVEVSVDGGATWTRAAGTTSWSCVVSFGAPLGSRTIQARAVDDSCNVQTSVSSRTVTVGPRPLPCSIWDGGAVPSVPASTDTSPIEVGVRFRAVNDGFITGLRFYKGSGNGGVHVGSLWTASGSRLASATFSGETATGWQTVSIPPTPVAANTTYIASVFMPQGQYAVNAGYFGTQGYDAYPLLALASGEDGGGNGVYRYGSSGFPSATFGSSNYWVDVVYDDTDHQTPRVVDHVPSAGLESVNRTLPVRVTFSEGIAPASVQFQLVTAGGSAIAGTTAYDGPARTVSFTSLAPLPALTTFTATVNATDVGGTAMTAPYSWTFSTTGDPGTVPTSLWDSSATPATTVVDGTELELGVKFRCDAAGLVTALRYYRAPGSAGSRVGHLWDANGALLATASYTGETSSGWQQVQLPSPVPVAKDAIYIASYHISDGVFAVTGSGLQAQVDRGPLHAPASAVSFGNGVYRYGAAGPPNDSWNANNYWADVVFTIPPDVTGPTVADVVPAPALIAVATAAPVWARFSEAVAPASVTFTLNRTGGAAVAGTVSYDAASSTASFTPSAALATGTGYTASVHATDVAGNPMAQVFTWSFTTVVPAGSAPATLWDSAAVPATPASPDSGAIEVGLRFQPARDGAVVGVRFYKGEGNSGNHVGHLWSASGTPLGTVAFTAETATGWQQAMFDTPIPVTSGSTYVVSYHAPSGHYANSPGFFQSTGVDRPPLSAPASGNGTYVYGAGGFPTSSHNGGNYWVDVIFVDTSGPSVIIQVPAPGATEVAANTTVAAAFNEAVVPATIVMELRDGSGAVIAGTTSYDAPTRTVQFTPNAPLADGATYTASVGGAQDQSGNPMAAPAIWSFTVAAASVQTIFGSTAPGGVDSGDGSTIELGVKFQANVAGEVDGVRFYKAAANTGTHLGRMWAGDGTLLAEVTFSGESASGWQYAAFSSPVAIQAGVTYVVSYYAPSGHYSADGGYLATERVNGSLRALASGQVSGNGVYRYGSGGGFPTSTYNSTNYWVDVRFRAQP